MQLPLAISAKGAFHSRGDGKSGLRHGYELQPQPATPNGSVHKSAVGPGGFVAGLLDVGELHLVGELLLEPDPGGSFAVKQKTVGVFRDLRITGVVENGF